MRLLQQLLPHSHPPPHSYSTLSTLGSRLCRSATLKCQTRQQQRRNLSTNLHEWQAKQFLASRYQVPIQRFTTVVKVNETNVALQSLRQQSESSSSPPHLIGGIWLRVADIIGFFYH
ncbi:MAG: hypothetical protein MHMPM18_002250 [Marteilia pararefringens]